MTVALIEAIRTGQKITAIKELRALTGLGLLESKNVIEALSLFISLSPTPFPSQHENAEHMVLTRTTDAYENHFEQFSIEWSLSSAMDVAADRAAQDYDVRVCRVVAKTKRMLVTV